MYKLCLLFERQGIMAKTDSRINQNHNAEYSDQMAEWIENHKAEFYHNAEYFTKLKSTKKIHIFARIFSRFGLMVIISLTVRPYV